MNPEYIELSTKLGRLKGLVKKPFGLSEKVYYSFQGIPYAKPPLGKLRFKAPEPFGGWKELWDATVERNDSLQNHMLFKTPTGDEDCLHLNVYTPQKPGENLPKKPVMVWIYGGGFSSGSGSSELYGPDFLIAEDIVLVTINYRCGVLGFLSLGTASCPGNTGLKDQVLALRWVKDNIDSFGGDSHNVTIFGESAGAASVNYHLLSPLSRGLFHKAILQSGTSTCQWAFQNKPLEKALLLASELGCSSKDVNKVLEFLGTVPALKLLKAQESESLRNEKEKVHKGGRVFLPCVEVAGDAPFLSEYPRQMLDKGAFAKVPIIIGVNDREGLLALSAQRVSCDRVNNDVSVMIPHNLATSGDKEEENRLGREILHFYTKSDTLSWDFDVMNGYIDCVTDIGFAIASENTRQTFVKHNTFPTYSYQFTYASPRSLSYIMIPRAPYPNVEKYVGSGASHGDELVHLFKYNFSNFAFVPPSAEDLICMTKLVKAWTTFAKTGNPNCNELGVTWHPDSVKKPNFLEMGKVWRRVDGISFPARMEFWKKTYGKYSYSY